MQLNVSLTQLTPSGDLIVTLPSPLNERLRYGPWAVGLPIDRCGDGPWVPESLDPDLPLLHAAQEADADAPVQRFTASIPLEVRLQAGAYRYLQTTLLQWVARRTSAADLLQHTPHLLWLLLATASEEQWTPQEIDGLLAQRRVEILYQLTGIRSPAAVKFLHRIVLHRGDATELAAINAVLSHPPWWRDLSHWPQIPIHVLGILPRYPQLSGSRLLRHLADRAYPRLADAWSDVRRRAGMWQDTQHLGTLLGIDDASRILARCPTFEAVEQLHDRWVARLNRRRDLVTDGRRRFPPPPLPGNAVIHPILTEEDLWAEGRLMHHCVASYADRVWSGTSYLYRLLHPQRATIEVGWQGSTPVITQCRLAHNHEPSAASWQTVFQWLHDCIGRIRVDIAVHHQETLTSTAENGN